MYVYMYVCKKKLILTGMELSFTSDMTVTSAMEKLSARKVSKLGMPRRWPRSTTNVCLQFCPCTGRPCRIHTDIPYSYIRRSKILHTYTLTCHCLSISGASGCSGR